MDSNKELKVIAKGLKPPGPLLIVKNELKDADREGTLRVIVSNREAAEELVEFFSAMGAELEIDGVGDDFHVIVNLSSCKEV